jgi:hypothetical protein
MACTVVKILTPFLEFCKTFFTMNEGTQLVYNYVGFTLQKLECLQEFIGWECASRVMQDYDREFILPLFIKVLEFWVPHCSHTSIEIKEIYDNYLFGVEASNEKATHALLVKELSLFGRVVTNIDEVANPLEWWKNNKAQFLAI